MLLEKNWQCYPTSQEGALEVVNRENTSSKDTLWSLTLHTHKHPHTQTSPL